MVGYVARQCVACVWVVGYYGLQGHSTCLHILNNLPTSFYVYSDAKFCITIAVYSTMIAGVVSSMLSKYVHAVAPLIMSAGFAITSVSEW